MRVYRLGLLVLLEAVAAEATQLGQSTAVSGGTEPPQFWEADAKTVTLPAPNGKVALKVTGKRTGKSYPEDEWVPEYYLEKNGKRLNPEIVPFSMPRASWSPDSSLLAMTSSDGGLVGNWRVYVYSVDNISVITHDVMKQVQADLARAFPAGVNPKGQQFFSEAERNRFTQDPSWVNVNVVKWLSNPVRLVVVASVPPSSGYGANSGRQRAQSS